VISEDLDRASPLMRWVSGNPLHAPERERVYRLLATTPSVAVRNCIAGRPDACAAALGLGVQGDALRVWYTPEERRELVTRLDVGRAGSVSQRLCVEESRIEACDELLSEDRRRWAPLPGSVRASLLRFALERGGAGAWGRLLARPDLPPEAALAHVSGLDTDALVSEWRVWLVEGRPRAYAGFGARSLLTSFWILFFAAMATRSTRWRSR